MDIAAAICAQTHTGQICVTASLDHVVFKERIKVGEVVYLEARVTRAFRTSLEVMVEVWMSGLEHQGKTRTNEAYFTFVAVDENGQAIQVPELVPETKEDRKLFDEASARREQRRNNYEQSNS
jgi:acyl-CoA hydrolase